MAGVGRMAEMPAAIAGPVAGMARMAAVLRQRDEVLLLEALEQASGAATEIVRPRRVDQGRLQRILIVESHGEPARGEQARAGHSGREAERASASGGSWKTPEHPASHAPPHP